MSLTDTGFPLRPSHMEQTEEETGFKNVHCLHDHSASDSGASFSQQSFANPGCFCLSIWLLLNNVGETDEDVGSLSFLTILVPVTALRAIAIVISFFFFCCFFNRLEISYINEEEARHKQKFIHSMWICFQKNKRIRYLPAYQASSHLTCSTHLMHLSTINWYYLITWGQSSPSEWTIVFHCIYDVAYLIDFAIDNLNPQSTPGWDSDDNFVVHYFHKLFLWGYPEKNMRAQYWCSNR